MPAVQQQLPPSLRGFEFHGVALSWKEGDDEARGDCPFCSREQKLYVNAENGQWNCRVCSESGNLYTMMRRLWEEGNWTNRAEDLATEKGLSAPSLALWGVRCNPVTGDVVCPGYDAHGKVIQVYVWSFNHVERRWYWKIAKNTNHWMFGVDESFDPSKPDIYVAEGLWDGVAFREALKKVGRDHEGNLYEAENESESLYATSNVIAAPTASTFSEQWWELFADKRVHFLYDNDHPDKLGRCSGMEGTKHAVNVLVWGEVPPLEMKWLCWHEDEGYDPSLKHGYDLRDLLSDLPPREAVAYVLSRLQPVPAEWVEGAKKKGRPLVEPLECTKWEDLVEVCCKGLSFHEGMDRGLSVMLAAAASVDIGLDQLWVKFVGPPSSGKTTLADGLLVARKYTTLKSVVSGIHSGYKGPESEGDKDYSFMAAVKGRAVIMKDGDTLLQAENRAKTLADLRDAYDRKTSTFFKNGINRTYEDHPFVMLVYGTSAMRVLDTSELGQRMLDCVIMDGVDEKVENDVLDHKKRMFRLILGSQSTANGDRSEGKELLTAKRMIGGYLIWLRENIKYLIEGVSRKTPERHLNEIEAMAKFVATFRARPSTSQTEEESRELAGRLFDQLSKLAACLAVVLNRDAIDKEVMRRVKQTALDSCRGKTLRIAKCLYKAGPTGKDVTSIGIECSLLNTESKPLLMFLRKIGVAEAFAKKGKVGLGASSNRWRLNSATRKLYSKVLA